jgi:asparagine synthase (glutamine-hydrolysing)
MCGIAGVLTTNPDLDLPPLLAVMREALRHRGPDDAGTEVVSVSPDCRVGLAHTRLAILDLSAAGHQPMADAASGSWIVYNGEVYNHLSVRRTLPEEPYRSTSDTETILKGWVHRGDGLLASLRGMFAFALLDGRRRRFWLVRDRLGVKPLYAGRVDADTWVFASELRALLASGLVPRRLDAAAVEAYLDAGAAPAPWTLLAGARSLLPGEAWCFDLDRPASALTPERRRYWLPTFADRNSPPIDRAAAVERLRPVLREAASLRMLSDVPVGVFLSGGIDSSSLVALLSHEGHTPHTFSVIFDGGQFDESEYSRLIAERFGTKHTELCLRPADVLRDFEAALDAYDQPSIDGLNSYHIAKATRAAGVKVALSGLGGDELFGGYPYFRAAARLARPFARPLARLAYHGLRLFTPGSSRTHKLGQILAGDGSALNQYLVFRQVMAADRRGGLKNGASASFSDVLPPEVRAELAAAASRLDPVNAQSLLELSLYLANMLLRDTDQMSMAHALEVREPLLDHLLVETAALLPGPLKLARSARQPLKALLLEALPVELPARMLRRPKMGFVFPWEQWLRQELRPQLEATFADAEAVRNAGLDPAGVQNLWQAFLTHRPGVRYTDVFSLSHLIHWVRRHRLAVVAAEPAVPLAVTSSC